MFFLPFAPPPPRQENRLQISSVPLPQDPPPQDDTTGGGGEKAKENNLSDTNEVPVSSLAKSPSSPRPEAGGTRSANETHVETPEQEEEATPEVTARKAIVIKGPSVDCPGADDRQTTDEDIPILMNDETRPRNEPLGAENVELSEVTWTNLREPSAETVEGDNAASNKLPLTICKDAQGKTL